MYIFLMVLFVILCLFLGLAILLQQGKGDMGLGSLGGGSQVLFGGSGGQEFFEKITWAMCALFVFGALGLTIIKSKEIGSSRIKSNSSLTQQKKTPPQMPIQKGQTESKEK